jgi:hypothetical protein
MEVQLALTACVVGLAAGYVLLRCVRAWRWLRAGANCTGGCGCAKTPDQQPALIAPEQLKLRTEPHTK